MFFITRTLFDICSKDFKKSKCSTFSMGSSTNPIKQNLKTKHILALLLSY